MVRLEPDVAASFPTADAVIEALRFLIRITKENKPTSRGRPRTLLEAGKAWARIQIGIMSPEVLPMAILRRLQVT